MPQSFNSLRRTCRYDWLLAAIATTSALSVSLPADAVVLRLGPLTFSEAGGDFVLTNGRVDPGGFVLEQAVFGPDINLFVAIDGFRSACPSRDRGGCYFQVTSTLTNQTGTPWIFFDHELQENFGLASPEEDGLSFAQGLNQFRPFVSSHFGRVDEVTDVRDFVNFSNGVVAPGDSVTFRYVIADTTPLNRFFLLQRPNFQVGGIGFVNPTPDPVFIPEPIPSPVAVDPIPDPLPDPTTGSDPGSSNPEIDNSAAVPEPSTVLGFLLFGAIASKLRSKQSC